MRRRLFFATDLHGSSRCFNKFLSAATSYEADTLFLGGDYSSKNLIVFCRDAKGVTALGNDRSGQRFHSTAEFDSFRHRQESSGSLFYELGARDFEALDAEAYGSLLQYQMRERLGTWIEAARTRLPAEIDIYVIPGNDDDPVLDEAFADPPFRWVHGSHAPFWNGWSVLGWGGSNPTPWHTVREFPEEEIAKQLDAAFDAACDPATTIFFVHPPPFGAGLDNAPAIDADFRPRLGVGASATIPVGSRAVREMIERRQPALGLFGHVHESAGQVRIGSTICVNPGSQYYAGRLAGAIIDLEDDRVTRVLLTEG